ncbi:MAG: polysaccharide biosynthesis protein [Hyphomicrobiaceae bacterium]
MMREWLLQLPAFGKRLIVVASDLILLTLSLCLAFYIRLDDVVIPVTAGQWSVFIAGPLLGLIGLRFAGVYRLIIRDIGVDGLRRIALGVAGSVIAWGTFSFLFSVSLVSVVFVPRSVVFGHLVLSFIFLALSRAVAYVFFSGRTISLSPLKGLSLASGKRRTAVVVGYELSTPKVARQIAMAGNYRIVGIVHDDVTMQHRKVDGFKIYPPDELLQVIERNDADEIFLLASKFTAARRVEIIKSVGKVGVSVKHFPTFSDIESGRVNVSDLRPVNVMQLLGRDPVPPINALLETAVRGKTVLITGAGGSIGSELARMTSGLGPKRVILFDASETALYEIEQELAGLAEAHAEAKARHSATPSANPVPGDPVDAFASPLPDAAFPEVAGILGSVCSETDLETVFRSHDIDVIYHAAAYKHVPIVEQNMSAGVRNNAFGTMVLARLANRHGIGQLIMISTDKAVRPTNVMGASKRLAEIILQSMASKPENRTKFSMVRFGNVLGSSGSVVPLFQEQIASGGPITVTHPDIVRYFMSIPEAVQLVIQTGAMAEPGALYVLDMGEPVKIVDLAKAMINLAGLSVRSPDNPDGDIAIDFVGLREGEKLYEELLIDGNSVPTRHSRIRQQIEASPKFDELASTLAVLDTALDTPANGKEVQRLLGELVDEYAPWPPSVIPFRRVS